MKINDIINKLKNDYHGHYWNERLIDEETTRDKVLYGSTELECTGIVTTCFCSIYVIEQAHNLNCNLIIAHEGMFYNHGDKTSHLVDNAVFLKKKKLLDSYGITVWRNHDYIHAGIPLEDGKFVGGIFYGFTEKLGWHSFVNTPYQITMNYFFKEGIRLLDLAKYITEKLEIQGVRMIGNENSIIHTVRTSMHILGNDNQEIQYIEENDIDCLLTMEMVDYTVQEYVRDGYLAGFNKSIISIGHFNVEEPGMEFFANCLKRLFKNINIYFVKSQDPFKFVTMHNYMED